MSKDTGLDSILTKLWCAVDIEDITEELIDIGEIDDAKAAIKELFLEIIDEADPGAINRDPNSIYWGNVLRKKVENL